MSVAVRSFVLLALLLALTAGNLAATEEYAAQTGRDCAVCHLDPAGGGELTQAGRNFAEFLSAGETTGPTTALSQASALFRLVVGYLHILFGFFWFGTILYVHLILKPGYASRGLPRGEVKLGLLSMVVMGISGAILYHYRVPDSSVLLETRFGMLLLAKIVLYLIMVVSALVAVFIVGPRLKRKRVAVHEPEAGDMTPAQLAQCDGKEGRRACFAYKGLIYDATDSRLWKNGTHVGRHQAGFDLTEALAQAPHEEDRILALPQVGRLLAEADSAMTPPQKLFYVMAYMNLGFVLLIILILACWKWW